MAVIQDININVHGQPSEKRLQTFLRLSQNENGRMINFRVLGPPLPSNCTATFSGTKPDGNVYSKTGTVTGNFVIIEEDIQMTAVAGVWDAKLDIINGTHNIMTALIRVVVDADVVDPDAIASDSQLQGLVAEAKYYAEHARTDAYGSPLTAATAAEMTDRSRVYVYTGTETGMTAGNWYTWNGSAWVSGGVYNAVAVQTDTTLSVAGKAADGKATGDAINELKEDLNSADEQLAMLIAKTRVAPTEITQCVNLTGAKVDGTYYYNVRIDVPWIGRYDMNPNNQNMRFYYMNAYDKDGNQLTLYRNGEQWTMIGCPNGGYIVKVDKRTIKTHTSSGVLDWTWTTDGDIEYLYHPDRYKGYLGPVVEAGQLIGVTYAGASETYAPYVEPSDAEYTYDYADEMISGVHSGLAESYTDAEPKEDSDNFVKSGGVVSYAFKDSYNLVDPDWFNWDGSGTISMPSGFYVPVTEGKYLICNCEKVGYDFYDANNTQVGTRRGTAIAYNAILVPTGAVKMRIFLNNGPGYIPSDHKVVIYYSEKDASPTDDRKQYIPHKNLQGDRGSSEIFDFYAPTALDKEVLQMAKYSAVRNMNFCDNVVRIGTFNMYYPRGTRGWALAKKMFADFAVDAVGFQEVSTTDSRVLTEFLKGWQFTDGVVLNNVAVASHFKVLSYNSYVTTVTNRYWMRAIIQLPRYADAINPTLSIYDYHGIWEGGTAEKRAQEVAEILAVIAQDTSDFKVVVGDTNVTSPSEWQTWINAGFTPVNDGNGTITTIDECCLDNIFCGSGVTCKNWHVVPAEDYIVNISGQDLPISDHDFVFADLQFDFDSLIRT